MRHTRLSLGMVLTALVVLFVLQNMTVVEIRFLFWHFAVSRALVLMLVLVIGILIGWLLHSYRMHSKGGS